MAKDYGQLWHGATTTTDESKAVRNLVAILSDKEGRSFISRLERKKAELCIEILDHVSRGLFEMSPSSAISDGFTRRSQKATSSLPRNKLFSSR
jgi:hypothetical protein